MLSGSPIIYKCDPNKNDICSKLDCQKSCFMTTHSEFSKDGKKYIWEGNNVIEYKEDKHE